MQQVAQAPWVCAVVVRWLRWRQVEQQLAHWRNRSAHTSRRHLGHPLSNSHSSLHDYDGCMAVAKDLTAKLCRFREHRQRRYSVMGVPRTEPFAMRRLTATKYCYGSGATE